MGSLHTCPYDPSGGLLQLQRASLITGNQFLDVLDCHIILILCHYYGYARKITAFL